MTTLRIRGLILDHLETQQDKGDFSKGFALLAKLLSQWLQIAKRAAHKALTSLFNTALSKNMPKVFMKSTSQLASNA
jgi:hypothetical protein